MKVNREKFLAAALLLSAVTGCDRLGLKGKETAKAAPEVASAQIANDPSVAPAAEADPAKPGTAQASGTPKNVKAKIGVGLAKGVVGPGNEVIAPGNEVIAPGKEVIAPNNEGVIAPGKEVISPGNEIIPPAKELVAPANENPANNTKLPHGQIAPGGRPRGVR